MSTEGNMLHLYYATGWVSSKSDIISKDFNVSLFCMYKHRKYIVNDMIQTYLEYNDTKKMYFPLSFECPLDFDEKEIPDCGLVNVDLRIYN